MMRTTLALPALLAAALAGVYQPRAGAAPAAAQLLTRSTPGQTPAPATETRYTVGPSDVLKIQVFNEDSLSGSFRVDADGAIGYPHLGRIHVAGRTEQEIAAIIEKSLANGYVNRPQVGVQVETFRSRKIFIMGEVRTPGMYALQGDNALLEVLAMAGSMTSNASSEVVVLRPQTPEGRAAASLPDDNQATQIRIDLQAIEQGRMSGNIALQDGDTVFVPKAEKFYISGHVRSPNAYSWTKGMTLEQAIALAGGLTDRGSRRRIKVRRETKPGSGVYKVFDIKMTDPVLANDTITVPQRLI